MRALFNACRSGSRMAKKAVVPIKKLSKKLKGAFGSCFGATIAPCPCSEPLERPAPVREDATINPTHTAEEPAAIDEKSKRPRVIELDSEDDATSYASTVHWWDSDDEMEDLEEVEDLDLDEFDCKEEDPTTPRSPPTA